MAWGTPASICRNVTQGQLSALLLVKMMEAQAARGESRFAAQFMVLADKRDWDALAALAALFAGTAPSPRDFRYAVPRNKLVLSLKICCAVLVLAFLAVGSLWLSQRDGPRPGFLKPRAAEESGSEGRWLWRGGDRVWPEGPRPGARRR
jgi:hypothetical protein